MPRTRVIQQAAVSGSNRRDVRALPRAEPDADFAFRRGSQSCNLHWDRMLRIAYRRD